MREEIALLSARLWPLHNRIPHAILTVIFHSRVSRSIRLALVAALACTALIAQKDTELTAPVIGISDGDTIRVLQDGVSKRIRLWGIDCPEVKQAFGTGAKQFTSDLAFRKTVVLRVHDVDRYGRQGAEVILPDGHNLNREIVRAGFAWYRQYARHDARA